MLVLHNLPVGYALAHLSMESCTMTESLQMLQPIGLVLATVIAVQPLPEMNR
jgi:hypothetical protein